MIAVVKMVRTCVLCVYAVGALDSGTAIPLQTSKTCANRDTAECTDPQFVDGETYRLAIAVNGQIPGPTLVVATRNANCQNCCPKQSYN